MINNSIQIKDSEIDWIGKFPSDWELLRIKNIFKLSREKIDGQAEKYQIYSLTMQGLKKRDVSTNEGQVAASYDNYARLRENDIVLNPMDLISGFIGRQKEDGIISPAYSLLRPRNDYNTRYFERYLQYHYFYRIFFPFGKGVSYDYRWTLGDITLMNFPILKPPKKEQEKIVEFLDEKTENISRLIEKKKKMIELLKEKRSSIITHAVTKGLDLNVEIKDSGVDWIGETPESWELIKIKSFIKNHYSGVWGEEEKNDKNDMLCLRVADFDYEKLSISLKNKTVRNIIGNYSHKILKRGNLLLEKSGGGEKTSVGRVVLFDLKEKAVCSNFVEKLTINNISTKFILYIFFCMHYGRINTKHIRQTTGIQNLFLSSYFSEFISVPSSSKQEKIVEYLDKKTSEIDDIISKIEKQIKLLGDYRASLIYHAVTGKMMDEI
jgi:type I restriction enzyme S subunit